MARWADTAIGTGLLRQSPWRHMPGIAHSLMSVISESLVLRPGPQGDSDLLQEPPGFYPSPASSPHPVTNGPYPGSVCC